MPDLDAIKTLGQTPIPGDKPGGESVMLDADYEAMRAEVQKLDSVSQDPVNWSTVVDTAVDKRVDVERRQIGKREITETGDRRQL